MRVGEENVLPSTNFVSDGCIVQNDFLMCRWDSCGEVPFNIFSIFSEFLLAMRGSEFNHFDGGIPGAGPFATHLDLLGWLRSTKGDFSRSHASNVLFRSGYMVQ